MTRRMEMFTENERSLLFTALGMANDQWRKDAEAVPELKRIFEYQIKIVTGFLEEMDY